VLEPSDFEFAMSTVKLGRHKSLDIDKIPAKLIYAVGRTIRSQIHKLLHSVWNKKELPEQWKQSVTLSVYRKGNKTDCSNYRGLSLFPTLYKILSNILLSRLTSYVQKTIGVSSTWNSRQQVNCWSYILHLSNTLEKKGIQWSSASAVYRLQESLVSNYIQPEVSLFKQNTADLEE